MSYTMYMPCINMAYIQMPDICQTYDWQAIDIYFSYVYVHMEPFTMSLLSYAIYALPIYTLDCHMPRHKLSIYKAYDYFRQSVVTGFCGQHIVRVQWRYRA
jgi:hypothetical protein